METKSVVVKEGNGLQTIKVIKAEDPSERTFKNSEFKNMFGHKGKLCVLWEFTDAGRLISLDSAKIWWALIKSLFA